MLVNEGEHDYITTCLYKKIEGILEESNDTKPNIRGKPCTYAITINSYDHKIIHLKVYGEKKQPEFELEENFSH